MQRTRVVDFTFVIALFAGLGATRAQLWSQETDVVAIITNLERGVKADLAGDTAFYQKALPRLDARGG